MRRLAPFVLLAAFRRWPPSACRRQGQFGHVPPDVRAWFKSVIAPNGVPCCDEFGRTSHHYDVRGGAYWVPIEGQWMQVPDRAVIRDQGNPIGEAVVWYVHHRGTSSSAASCRRTRCRPQNTSLRANGVRIRATRWLAMTK